MTDILFLFYDIHAQGTIRIKGGKSGYETRLVSFRGLVNFPNKFSKPFATILWNGDELCETMPEQIFVKDPVFNETVNIPFSEMSTKLENCTLEYQVWGTVGRGEGIVDEDARGDFAGSLTLTGTELVNFLKSNLPYSNSIRSILTTSTSRCYDMGDIG